MRRGCHSVERTRRGSTKLDMQTFLALLAFAIACQLALAAQVPGIVKLSDITSKAAGIESDEPKKACQVGFA